MALTLGHSTYKQEEEKILFPDNWLTSYSWGEKKALWVFKSQVTSSVYFHNDGTPDQDKLSQLKTEVDTGLWDNYLLWVGESYENLSTGTNLSNIFLQIANAQYTQQSNDGKHS